MMRPFSRRAMLVGAIAQNDSQHVSADDARATSLYFIVNFNGNVAWQFCDTR